MTPWRFLAGGVIPSGEDRSSVVACALASHTVDLTGRLKGSSDRCSDRMPVPCHCLILER
ncbi:hypothetical protein RB10167 [Rhodopirellula baltica SH 1]|uniref:Uncharacterized protein n=1 Tax=Rhodopirellula baltica (strain DSM 10527 / NCIMB 13988 / SH1) TaxID=243090 RepID=Q7UFE3_RHOBA|nr:hypothetical protein RB10167 [Rhodopirellula baltica SH 1]